MPITKHNFTVRRVEDLADTMRSAFRIAQSGRKGPVLVDIPKDVTAAVCEFTPKHPEPIRTVTTFDEQQVKWAADIINAAQRPLVYFGGGVRSAASCQPLRDLLHKAEIRKFHAKVMQKGYSIVPLQIYLKNGRVKAEIALARGKKLFDKRDDMAKKDAQRDIERSIKAR